MNRMAKFGMVVLALVWVFLVTFNYYIVHKPFGVENALGVLIGFGNVHLAVMLLAQVSKPDTRTVRGSDLSAVPTTYFNGMKNVKGLH